MSGTAAVISAASELTRHTRRRAGSACLPCRIHSSESHPPANPPSVAKTGGIHAIHAAWTSVRPRASTRNSVVQLLQSE